MVAAASEGTAKALVSSALSTRISALSLNAGSNTSTLRAPLTPSKATGGGPEGQPATDAEVSTAVETNALAEMLQQVLRAQRRQEEKLNYLCKEFRELSSRQRVNG